MKKKNSKKIIHRIYESRNWRGELNITPLCNGRYKELSRDGNKVNCKKCNKKIAKEFMGVIDLLLSPLRGRK